MHYFLIFPALFFSFFFCVFSCILTSYTSSIPQIFNSKQQLGALETRDQEVDASAGGPFIVAAPMLYESKADKSLAAHATQSNLRLVCVVVLADSLSLSRLFYSIVLLLVFFFLFVLFLSTNISVLDVCVSNVQVEDPSAPTGRIVRHDHSVNKHDRM